VRAPVLLLHGLTDVVAPVEPVRALAAEQPALRLVEIAETGHNPYYVRKRATAEAIRSFLNDVDRHAAADSPSATLSAAGK
jgi:pimeloyl-ACP methyl ester carboxylesterase